jgi:RNA polymerase sigma factor (sigma-70 family)
MLTLQDILFGIEGDNKKTIEGLKKSVFPFVLNWILKNHGTKEDAKDVFHDALLIVLDKIQTGRLTLNCEFSTYLISVCKHLWYHELRKKSRIVLSEQISDGYIDIPYDPIEDKKYQIYLSLIEKLDSRSQELIKHVLEKKSQSEIAEIMNFKNIQAVADKKKNCLKKLIKDLIENKEYKEFRSEISIVHRECHFK